jgi:hypothetical protein
LVVVLLRNRLRADAGEEYPATAKRMEYRLEVCEPIRDSGFRR